MKEGTRLDALAVTYCLAAAACGTLAGSLTVLGTGCASLLLIGTVLRLWGHKPSPLRSACALLPAAALAAAVPRLVALDRGLRLSVRPLTGDLRGVLPRFRGLHLPGAPGLRLGRFRGGIRLRRGALPIGDRLSGRHRLTGGLCRSGCLPGALSRDLRRLLRLLLRRRRHLAPQQGRDLRRRLGVLLRLLQSPGAGP